MIKMLNKKETAELVETFEDVAHNAYSSENARKYYLSHYTYAVADDGETQTFIKFKKPSITSEIWYDDEQESPFKGADKKEVFISYNMRRNFHDDCSSEWFKDRKEAKELFEKCCPGKEYKGYADDMAPFIAVYRDNAGSVIFPVYRDTVERNDKAEKRFLTPEEIEDIATIYEEQKAAYLKRLETYYKRYESKICARGYWRNR